MSRRLYQSGDNYAFYFFLGYIGMMVDSLNDSSDYLFLDLTFIVLTLNSLSRGIFRSDNMPEEVIVKIVYCFHGQTIGINTR
ncbi:hypothetical protein H5410_015504 [Solanum commersonii]|uniref:Uncharacterized protein n=1 Tax=Solanum commersonii TaxID=4109 RepID=A0A9J5ZU11_SOLCO|nr:hypothetical protein H5410_015504 [Solanum commersonii]